jgi:hypothetical protein
LVLYREVAMLGISLSYIFYGLIRHWRRSRRPRTGPGNPPAAEARSL